MHASFGVRAGWRNRAMPETPELNRSETGMTSTTAQRLSGDAIERAMLRAVEIAANGPARGVNPQVGCVVLAADGTILAEGWHRGAGTPHAEVDALSKLAAGEANGATAVVTLEPCNHTGLTGPCSV